MGLIWKKASFQASFSIILVNPVANPDLEVMCFMVFWWLWSKNKGGGGGEGKD